MTEQLHWTPGTSFDQIPRHLLEQVKGRQWEVDTLLALGPRILTSPLQFLILMIVEWQAVRGFLWVTACPLTDSLALQAVSVDREYQGSDIPSRTMEVMRELRDELGLARIFALTTRGRALKRHGWAESNLKIMEM